MKITTLQSNGGDKIDFNIYIEKSELCVQCKSRKLGLLYNGSALDVVKNNPLKELEDEPKYIQDTLIGISQILVVAGMAELHSGSTEIYKNLAEGTSGLNLFGIPWTDLRTNAGSKGAIEVQKEDYIETFYPEDGNTEIERAQILFKKERAEIIIAFIEAYRFAYWANAVRYETMTYMIEGNFS